MELGTFSRACVYQDVSTLKGNDDEVHLCTIMILPKDTGGQELRYIAHESVHVAYFLIDTLGIVIDGNNHEILAKLTDHIFQKATEFIDGKIK